MSDRVQLKHLLIDVDFFDKPKARALLHKFGPIAQLYLVRLYAALARATKATISIDAALGVAWELRIEKEALEILEYCIKEEMLERSSDHISNSRVASDQEALHKKQERWRKSKEKNVVSESIPRGTSEEGARKSENTELLNTEDLNRSKKDGVRYFGEFAEIDEIQYEQHAAAKGIDYLNRCFELINGWVGEVQGDPEEFKKRRLRAKNAGFLFQNWVFQRVDRERDEAARRGKSSKSNTPKPSQNVINQMASDRAVEIFLREHGND